MADLENNVRVTRLAKKRAAAGPDSQQQPATKKRVVLGELPNKSNVPVTQELDSEPQKLKCRSKKKVKKAVTSNVKENAVDDSDTKSDDPQMCSAYISDIYEYLHNLEVSGFLLFLSFYLEIHWLFTFSN